MENLTKENYFDNLKTRYPFAFDYFLQWIDKYKKDNNWDKIFNAEYKCNNGVIFKQTSPKFHELPLAFQEGIMISFYKEQKSWIMQKDLSLLPISEITRSFPTLLFIIETYKSNKSDI